MALFSVRLESQSDGQWRVRTLEAADEDEARRVVEAREARRAAYSLTDRRAVDQVRSRRQEDGVHASVNLDAFAGTGLSGRDLLDFVERDHGVDGDGKAYGPNRQIKNHLQAHYQAEPYKITSVDRQDPNVDQLISALVWLHEDKDGWKRMLERLEDEGVPLGVVTGALYGLTSQHMIDGSAPIVWSTATIQCSLHTAYTLDQDAHDFFNDVSATEVAATGGYAANGVTLGSKTSNYTSATDVIWLDAGDASWASSTISATDAIVWSNTAGASTTDPVMGAVDFGATVATTNGTFLVQWDATAGIIAYDVT